MSYVKILKLFTIRFYKKYVWYDVVLSIKLNMMLSTHIPYYVYYLLLKNHLIGSFDY